MFNLTYQGKSFNQREDGYVNLGQLCSTHDKKFTNWSRTQSAQEYILALAETLSMSESQIYTSENLVIASVDAIGGHAGTWGHPLIAIEVARWISPEFGVWCNQHIKVLMETGTTSLNENKLDVILSLIEQQKVNFELQLSEIKNQNQSFFLRTNLKKKLWAN